MTAIEATIKSFLLSALFSAFDNKREEGGRHWRTKACTLFPESRSMVAHGTLSSRGWRPAYYGNRLYSTSPACAPVPARAQAGSCGSGKGGGDGGSQRGSP